MPKGVKGASSRSTASGDTYEYGPDFDKIVVEGTTQVKARCKICSDLPDMLPSKMAKHRESKRHKLALQQLSRSGGLQAVIDGAVRTGEMRQGELGLGSNVDQEDPNFLQSALPDFDRGGSPDFADFNPFPSSQISFGRTTIPWYEAELRRALQEGQEPPLEADGIFDNEPQDDVPDEVLQEVDDIFATVHGDFAPWNSKGTFLLSLLANLPRHPFSHVQLRLVLSFARAMAKTPIPTWYAYEKDSKAVLEAVGGSKQHMHTSPEGNIFYHNDLGEALRRDFSNPRIRSKMNFYAREGAGMKEFRDGTFLASELPRNLQQVSAVLPNGTVCYLQEPLELQSGQLCCPERWVESGGVVTGQGLKIIKRGEELLLQNISISFMLSEVKRSLVHEDLDLIGLNGDPIDRTHVYRTQYNGEAVYTVPILAQLDDLSGGKSKKWNVHYAATVCNALLDRKFLQAEESIKFFSVSQAAKPMEQMEALVDQLSKYYQTPIRAYDSATNAFVRIKPYLLLLVGDNPMQAVWASSMGMQASFPCRYCRFGGSRKERQASSGIKAMMQPGTPRKPAYILEQLRKQVDLAKKDQHNKVEALNRQTGVKDAFTEEILTIVLQHNDDIRGLNKKLLDSNPSWKVMKSNTKITAEMNRFTEDLLRGERWYNPLLKLTDVTGFDTSVQLPGGILHTFTLGPAKYLLRKTFAAFKDLPTKQVSGAKDNLRVLLEALPTAGLPIGNRVNAGYLVQYFGSAVGKEIKVWAQLMPMVIPLMVEQRMLPRIYSTAWLALGTLGRLLYIDEIPVGCVATYKQDLSAALTNFYDAMADVDPTSFVSKAKNHLLAHLLQDIERFGPAKNFHEEQFESHNTVIRNNSIFSNRQAPSRDIGRKREMCEILRHIITGGFFAGKTNKWVQAGSAVRQESLTKPFLELYGLYSPSEAIIGKTWEKLKDKEIEDRIQEYPLNFQQEIQASDFLWFGKVVGNCGATYKLDDFCLLAPDVQYTGKSDRDIGVIRHIYKNLVAEPTNGIRQATLTVEIYAFTEMSDFYHLPAYVPLERENNEPLEVQPSDLKCLLNVCHDCHVSECAIKGDATVKRMERQDLTITIPAVEHNMESQRFILNTCLFRGSHLTSAIYPRPECDSDLETIATKAAKNISRKNKKKGTEKDKTTGETDGSDSHSEDTDEPTDESTDSQASDSTQHASRSGRHHTGPSSDTSGSEAAPPPSSQSAPAIRGRRPATARRRLGSDTSTSDPTLKQSKRVKTRVSAIMYT